ncbi:putative nicotinamide mononucleotide transmembrane transporter protein [Massarina eburnea CBS 473.64]|uniref:Putative nicotinamide mononucleotide transmembrane transporter protein n=1 Tax=Massarina eburnea CBS 473.64 TaxID=1395130 RepID=A0A6A6S9K4_9PLEO|nr:putative nicotinamide mononucleotide transmembrane transporter protein [Massarina eburnea CBS 473.64]
MASAGYSEKGTRRLLRKMDLKLIPFLALLYLLSFLDRSNIGNARLAGLERDLHMNPKSLQYNNALAVFFPFYVFAELPSNLMMKRSRPSLWIPSLMVAWGIMCCAMGAVKNYEGLLVIRAMLGLAEGGLFPGITFYITQWYRRHECGFRMALFFSAATAAGAFGGLLARGIMRLDHARGLGAWSWIFIIEGAITIVIALVAYFFMYDYPDTAKFLTTDDRNEVQRRLEADRSCLDDSFKVEYILNAVKDWKIWVHMLITFGIYSPLYSLSLFLPTIISNMGYMNEEAQLMTVPPYVVACAFCISAGWFADKHGQRGIYMIACNIIAIIGFSILITQDPPKYRYLGTFFAAAGIYSNVSQTVAWNGNNIGGSTKRSVGIAMQVGFGNLGGVLSGYTYISYTDAPKFLRGHAIVLGLLTMSTVLCIFMRFWCAWENKRRDAVDLDNGRNGTWTKDEMIAESGKGDHAAFFRYTV